jgi:hypothetical protein
MRIPRWRSYEPGVRLFDVECECGEQFRVPAEVEPDAPRPATGFLVPLVGRCPWCGLRLEEIEPFGDLDDPSRPRNGLLADS